MNVGDKSNQQKWSSSLYYSVHGYSTAGLREPKEKQMNKCLKFKTPMNTRKPFHVKGVPKISSVSPHGSKPTPHNNVRLRCANKELEIIWKNQIFMYRLTSNTKWTRLVQLSSSDCNKKCSRRIAERFENRDLYTVVTACSACASTVAQTHPSVLRGSTELWRRISVRVYNIEPWNDVWVCKIRNTYIYCATIVQLQTNLTNVMQIIRTYSKQAINFHFGRKWRFASPGTVASVVVYQQ